MRRLTALFALLFLFISLPLFALNVSFSNVKGGGVLGDNSSFELKNVNVNGKDYSVRFNLTPDLKIVPVSAYLQRESSGIFPFCQESSDYKTGSFSVLDLKTGKIEKNLNTYTLGGDIRCYFFSHYVFVVDAPNDANKATFYVYDVNNGFNDVIANYVLPYQNPHGIAFLSENKAYIVFYFENFILVFNPLTGEELGRIDLSSLLSLNPGTQHVGTEHLLLSGNYLFVSCDLARTYYGDPKPDKGAIVVIDTRNDSIVKVIETKECPRDMRVHGDYLYYLAKGFWGDAIGKVYRISLKDFSQEDTPYITSDYAPIILFELADDGSAYYVAGTWGEKYKVFRIFNIDYYRDSDRAGMEEIYESPGSGIFDISYFAGKLFIADRGTGSGDGALVVVDKKGNVTKYGEDEIGYPPYKLGTDGNY